jgi:hypothetical protein
MFRTINTELLFRVVIIVNVANLSAVNKNEFMAPTIYIGVASHRDTLQKTVISPSNLSFLALSRLSHNVKSVKISTVLMMPSVRRSTINIVTMLLVCLLQKENLLAIYIVCKGRIFFVEYLSNATHINRV